MRHLMLTAALLLSVACATEPAYIHIVDGTGTWSQAPVVPHAMTERISDAAAESETLGSVSRIAFYDIAFPADLEEFSDTNGHGVLLLTAVSQDKAELPPERVYVNVSGHLHELQLISETQPQPVTDPRVQRVLGPHRWDGLYVFPVLLAREGSVITLDFATNRDGFVFGKLRDLGATDLGYDPRQGGVKTSSDIPMSAIMKIVGREFPGFLSATAETK